VKLVSSENKNINKAQRKAGNSGGRATAPRTYQDIPINRSNQPLQNGRTNQYNEVNRQNGGKPQPPNGRTNQPPVNRAAPPQGRDFSKPKKRISPVITIVIILMIVIIGAAALVISLGFYVESLEEMFPNVWVEGIEVSGLTFDEMRLKLINEGYETNADGILVTINFPDETSFSFSGEDVGLSRSADEAARAAYTFGRTGTFFGNLRTYIDSVFERTDLNNLSTPIFDDAIIHTLVTEYTEQFNKTIIDGSLDHDDNSITVVKGMGLHLADSDAVFTLASHSLTLAEESHNHIIASYAPEKDDTNNLDVQIREIERLFKEVHKEAVTPKYEFDAQADGYIVITANSENGRTFDLEGAIEQLRDSDYGQPMTIHFETLTPEYTEADVKGLIFRDVLHASKTQVDGTSNRVNNVHRAARAIHGTVLLPGETFSFNGVVGQRTREKGYLPAGAFRSGRVEDVIGGGICQTASTLYDAVLHTDLEIPPGGRTAHGMIVTYLPFGNDATVNWPNIDFKFKNNSDFPIRIEHENNRGGRELVMRIIGTKLDDTKIEIYTHQISQQNYVTVDVHTDELYIGQTEVFRGFQGNVVETFKIHKSPDGEEISRKSLGISRYRLVNRTVRHGTKEPPPPDVVHVPDEVPATPIPEN